MPQRDPILACGKCGDTSNALDRRASTSSKIAAPIRSLLVKLGRKGGGSIIGVPSLERLLQRDRAIRIALQFHTPQQLGLARVQLGGFVMTALCLRITT